MNRFELYKDYTYQQIEEFGEAYYKDHTRQDYGPFQIGANFICLECNDGYISFIDTGQTVNGSIYTCIYTDFNTSNPIKKLEIELEHTKQLLTEATNGRT